MKLTYFNRESFRDLGFSWIIANTLVLIAFLTYHLAFSYQYKIYAEYETLNLQSFNLDVRSSNGVEEVLSKVNRAKTGEDARAVFIKKPRSEYVELRPSLILGQDGGQPRIKKISIQSKWGYVEYQGEIPAKILLNTPELQGTFGAALGMNWLPLMFSWLGSLVVLSFSRLKKFEREKTLKLLFIFTFSVFLAMTAKEVISERNIYGDGVGQLRAAYNLAEYGIFAEKLGSPPTRDNFIEPLPAFVNSIYLKSLAYLGYTLNFSEMRNGQLTSLVKHLNVAWAFVGLFAFSLFLWKLTKSVALAAVFAVLVNVFFFANCRIIDTYYTEVQGATLLLLTSMAAYFFVLKPSLRLALITGALAGLLALTKASFYYINWVSLLVLVGWLVFTGWRKANFTKPQAMGVAAALLVGYAAIVGPWMVRNHVHLDSFAVSDRGGSVLFVRATKNEMTTEEIRGAFYLYGPSIYHRLGAYWPYASASEIELDRVNGTWVRVNRNFSGQSFFAQLKPYFKSEFEKHDENGQKRSQNQVFRDLEKQAFEMIKADPIKHLGMSLVFTWRGMWGVAPIDFVMVKGHHDLIVSEFIMLLAYLASFGFVLLAFIKRQTALLGLSIFTAGGIAFYALLSHFLPRYMLPMYPMLFLMFGLVASEFLKLCINKTDCFNRFFKAKP